MIGGLAKIGVDAAQQCSRCEYKRYLPIKPHTLANAVKNLSLAEIAKTKARHLLTSSFRSREFIAPTIARIERPAGYLIMATNGFWAELSPDQQTSFLHPGSMTASTEQDDCSALLISLAQTETVGEIISQRVVRMGSTFEGSTDVRGSL